MSSSAIGQQLHNGIELPSVWPPRNPSPTVAAEMDAPYLQQKPKTITINVGRQLFVDPFLIRNTNLQSTYHTPNFYPGNPVLQADKEWEKTRDGALYAAPFSDGIWYDEKEQKFKMWYLAGAGILHKKNNQTFFTGYAESKDGKHWTKPNMGVFQNTNIVDTFDRDAATVWLDKAEKDPSKKYKFVTVERNPYNNNWQYLLKYSADGIKWGAPVALSGGIGDRSTAFYNPFTNKWALSIRAATAVSGRSRNYSEGSDLPTLISTAHEIRPDIQDKNVVFWFTPSNKEPRHPKFPEVSPGIYNFDAIAYESIILGQYSVWQGPENNIAGKLGIQKRNEILLGYSRDGFHFYRPSYKPFMAVNETEGAWNWGNMQSANGTPLIVGDSLYFYSSGRRLNKIMWDSDNSTGLATLRRDGFVSMKTEKSDGFLETETVSFDGNYLFVNANVAGSFAVEVLDEQGTPIPGFTKKESVVLKKLNSTKQVITWKKHKTLTELANQKVRFKFYINNGEMYSFWVSPWETGESRGYTSGGGPGLNPSGVDTKF